MSNESTPCCSGRKKLVQWINAGKIGIKQSNTWKISPQTSQIAATELFKGSILDKPDANTMLARYFPRNRLFGQTGLLETRSLYLPLLGKQHDILEGIPTKATLDGLAQTEAQVGNPEFVAKIISGFTTLFSREVTYASCWTKNTTPSQQSANEYGNAIAIIFTTVGRLQKTIPHSSKLGEVQYVREEYDQRSLSLDIVPFTKREKFSWEKEVRVVDYSEHKGGLVQQVIENAPSYKSYSFDPSDLITKIMILPSSSCQDKIMIENFARSHSIEAESLAKWPL